MNNLCRISFLALFFGIALGACKPEDGPWPDTIVTGTVVDTSMISIEGAAFTLFRREITTDFLGATDWKDVEIKNVQTDANGYFKLSFCMMHYHTPDISEVHYVFDVKKNGYQSIYRRDINKFLSTDRVLAITPQ